MSRDARNAAIRKAKRQSNKDARKQAIRKAKRKGNGANNIFVQFFNFVLSIAVLGIIVGGLVLYLGLNRFNADGPMDTVTVFEVRKGASLPVIAKDLVDGGLVSDEYTFRIGVRALDKQSNLRAGEYTIAANASMKDILFELTQGRAVQHGVTIPEGFTSFQVVQRINEAASLTGELVQIPVEGSILPGTYNFERGTDRQKVLDQMADAQAEVLADIWANRDPDLPLTSPEELVILASIVEKETGLGSERDRVAAIFINRINKGMRLQSDPTIIYGITLGKEKLGRGLRQSEIKRETPYNTYVIPRLPIGPIDNPGIEALRATAHPAKTDDLYFVANGTGGHAFASNYAQHQKNVAQWRKIEKELAQAAQEASDALAEATKQATQALAAELAAAQAEEAGKAEGN